MSLKLLPGQVIVKDGTTGLEWIYDIQDATEFEFLTKRAKIDEAGNYILTMPEIASLKRWLPKEVLEKIDVQIDELGVPELVVNLEIPAEKRKIEFSDINNHTNQQLEQYLTMYGGFKAYLETQLAYYEAKQGVLEATYEEALAKMLYTLSQKYEKKPTKEVLHGEAIASSPQLKKLRQDLIEVEAMCRRVQGLRDSYRAVYDTVSRVVALRISSRTEASS